MIHYQLRCGEGHGFDGWFRDSATFDSQCASGLVACPECGTVDVRRGLMAPSLGRKGRQARQVEPGPPQGPVVDQAGVEQPQAEPTQSEAPKAASVMPDGVRAMLQRLRSEVEKHCENVGPDFATEARRIHNGESEKRGIYGETTPDEAQALADDGIEVSRLPWIPRADS